MNETAKSVADLKAMLLADMSTCCRTTAKKQQVASEDEDTSWSPTQKDKLVAKKKEVEKEKEKEKTKETKVISTEPGPSSALPPTPKLVAPSVNKRPRELTPGTMRPGPLSKKLKLLQKEGLPLNKTQAKAVTPPTIPPIPDNNDNSEEPDIFSLLNPIVELEVPDADPEDQNIDPLELVSSVMSTSTPSKPNNQPQQVVNQYSGPSQPPPLAVQQPPVPISRPVHIRPVVQQFNNNNNFQQNQQMPLNPPPLQPQEAFMNHQSAASNFTPDMGNNLMFGGHFLDMNYSRPAAPPPIRPPPIRQTLTADRNGPIYHMVNGYRIDLKSAANKELITLPDGKVIYVRKHSGPGPTGVAPAGNANGVNYQISTMPWVRPPGMLAKMAVPMGVPISRPCRPTRIAPRMPPRQAIQRFTIGNPTPIVTQPTIVRRRPVGGVNYQQAPVITAAVSVAPSQAMPIVAPSQAMPAMYSAPFPATEMRPRRKTTLKLRAISKNDDSFGRSQAEIDVSMAQRNLVDMVRKKG